MKRILVIGAGQLGSRHLQALIKLKTDACIEVVEPNHEAMELAKERVKGYEINPCIKDILFYPNMDAISKENDLCIIATNSDVRLSVITQLLQRVKITNLILEKFLFQRLEEFTIAGQLFTEMNINVWVNCPRRTFPIFEHLKNEISEGSLIHLKVAGGDWGLACNAIHFIDLFYAITREDNIIVSSAELRKEVHSGKRKGYIEFSGTLNGRSASGHSFELTSKVDHTSPLQFEVMTRKGKYEFDEAHGCCRIYHVDGSLLQEIKYELNYQSNMTQHIAEKIFANQDCLLPTYQESKHLHEILLRCFLGHLEQITGNKENLCPIT